MAECCNGHCFLIYIHTDWCEVTRKELSWNSLNSWNVCICSATVKITDRSHWWHILIFFQNSRKFWRNVSSSNTWYDVYNRLKSSTTLLGSTIPIIPAPISPSGCSTTSSVIPVIISSSIAILEHKEYKLTFCIWSHCSNLTIVSDLKPSRNYASDFGKHLMVHLIWQELLSTEHKHRLEEGQSHLLSILL